jgi:hypothetical protein
LESDGGATGPPAIAALRFAEPRPGTITLTISSRHLPSPLRRVQRL